MNIFVISPDQQECAVALDDLRLRKMIVETAQLMCTAHHVAGSAVEGMYKPTHMNHPCAKWVRESRANYAWTWAYLDALLNEYKYRFSKHHKTGELAVLFLSLPKNILITSQTAFTNCSMFKDEPVHEAYKHTLRVKWENDKRPPKRTNRSRPEWA